MRLKTIPNSRHVLRRAWSMWAAYAAIAFAALDAMQPALADMLPTLQDQLPEHVFDWLTWLCLVAIPVLRILHQGLAAAEEAAEGQS